MKTLGERLCQFRKKNHMKQADLAKQLNVSQQVISNIECGRTSPSIEQLKKLGDIYHVSIDQLVGRDFSGKDENGTEMKIIKCIRQMDESEKELSLGLVSQVAQHRGRNNGN